MRRFLVSLVAAAALVLPATAALASDDASIRTQPCPYPQRGVVIIHDDPKTGYTEVWACV